jgi:hypothetical protein
VNVNAEDHRRLEELWYRLVDCVVHAQPGTKHTAEVRLDKKGHVCASSRVLSETRLSGVQSEPT